MNSIIIEKLDKSNGIFLNFFKENIVKVSHHLILLLVQCLEKKL